MNEATINTDMEQSPIYAITQKSKVQSNVYDMLKFMLKIIYIHACISMDHL